MPTLDYEANLLTNPSLQRGVIETIFDRGDRDLFMLLGFKPFEGSSYDWVLEKTLPGGNSARNPYACGLPEGVGSRSRPTSRAGALIRNADTAKIDVIGKSDWNDLHAEDIELAAKALARDFRTEFILGDDSWNDGYGYHLGGLEAFLRKYAGNYQSNSLVLGDFGDFREQKLFATTGAGVAGTPYGTAANLSFETLYDLVSRYKGEGFDVLFVNRRTSVEIMTLLSVAGGNVACHMMNERFGCNMFHFDGIPIVVLDVVGQGKRTSDDALAASAAAATGTPDTLTIDPALDPYWYGFTDIDIGTTFSLVDVTGAVTGAGSIDDVTGPYGAEITLTTGTAPVSGSFVQTDYNVIYAVRFDEVDGFSAIYHQNRGVPANAGEYTGPIAGFDAEELNLLEDCPKYRTRLDWYGNFVSHSPYSVARLSHFNI